MAHHQRDLAMSVTAADAFAARVLANSPLRFNRMNELSGTSLVDSSGNAFAGTYSGVDLANLDTLFPPDKAPFFDGVNDYANLYSAAFGTAFSMDEFTILVTCRPNSSAFWTDGVDRYWFRLVRDSNNRIAMQKSGNNAIFFECRVGSSNFNVLVGSQSDADWTRYAFSGSVNGGGLLNAGEVKAFKNGVQIGSTATGRIASVGSGLNSALTVLGAGSLTPTQGYHGWMAPLVILNQPINSAILASTALS